MSAVQWHFSKQIGMPRLQDILITADEQYGGILCFSIVCFFCRMKLGHNSLKLFGRLLQNLFPVKLQQRVCGLKKSAPDLSSA